MSGEWRLIAGEMRDIRRDFEDAARAKGWPLGRINEGSGDPTYRRDDHAYVNPTTQARWEAWQAAFSML